MAKKPEKPEKQWWNEWRLWLLGIGLLLALFALFPHYETTASGDTTISTNLNKGLDLIGGTRLLVAPIEPVDDQTLQQIVETLNARVSAFGLEEIKIRPVQSLEQNLVQIEAAGNNTALKDLIAQQGTFEARFTKTVTATDQLTVGDNTYDVTLNQNGVTVNDNTYTANDTFTLDAGYASIDVTVRNVTENTAALSLLAFDGSEIKQVLRGSQRGSGVTQAQGGWSFQFSVLISQTAADRFKAVAQAFPLQGAGQQAQLSAPIELYLDQAQIDELSVAAAFQQQSITQPQISGGVSATREQASKEMNQLQSILESGSLPVPIEIVSSNTISAALGREFAQVALTAILLAVVGVAGVLFARYRDHKVVFPIALTGFSEVFLLLGLFSTLSVSAPLVIGTLLISGVGVYFCYKHQFSSIFWLPLGSLLLLVTFSITPTLDLAAIAGIIAAVGTGVDDQIVMLDEGRKKELRDLWDRIKRAFFIIFTAAASTIGAMLPLMFVGAGALRGFAITTIVGILIGVFVTRPAFAEILVRLKENE